MAERIVSPGVFTREKDVSFLPQGIGEIGAAIIGPTKKGPAFVPTSITSFSEYENVFGKFLFVRSLLPQILISNSGKYFSNDFKNNLK